MEANNQKSEAQSILILINYSYFYDSFFRPLILRLGKTHRVHVWFDSRPEYLQQAQFQRAEADKKSGIIVEVKRVRLEHKIEAPTKWKTLFRTFQTLKFELEEDPTEDFNHVLALNSSLYRNLRVLEGLVNKGAILTVLRPMTVETNLRLLFTRARDSRESRMSNFWVARLSLIKQVLKSTAIQTLHGFTPPPWKTRVVRARVGDSDLETLYAPLVTLPFFLLRSYWYGLRDWLQSCVLFSNTRITHTVLVPNLALATVLSEIAPGPRYLAFGPGAPTLRQSKMHLGICAPPSNLEPKMLISFIDDVLKITNSQSWTTVSYRHHPNTKHLPDYLVSRLRNESTSKEVLINDSTFDAFAREHSHFVVPNSNSSLAVILKMHNPNSTLLVTETPIGKPSVDRFDCESLSAWFSTPEGTEMMVQPTAIEQPAEVLSTALDIFQTLDSILSRDLDKRQEV